MMLLQFLAVLFCLQPFSKEFSYYPLIPTARKILQTLVLSLKQVILYCNARKNIIEKKNILNLKDTDIFSKRYVLATWQNPPRQYP